MNKRFLTAVLSMLMAVALLVGMVPTAMAAETTEITQIPESTSMFLKMNEVTYIEPEDDFLTVLLCGLDFTENNGWRGSGNKQDVEKAHTDANMVIVVNKTKKQASLVSLPRDTLCYVPGVRGIYKLNCAVNCAPTIAEGLELTRQTASWLLGGIEIDYYAALDMDALIALGDLMGGLDYDMNMTYTGHTGKRYQEGQIHLDGHGMIDYLRARKNATIMSGLDIGRCDRNRRMFITIYEKFMSDPSLLQKLWASATSGELNFYTNVDASAFADLVDLMVTLGNDTVGSYMLTGEYKMVMDYWNFTITDQAHRQGVLKEVFGIDAPELPQVSFAFTEWLHTTGFPVGRQILIAKQILDYGNSLGELTENQKKALDALQESYLETIQAYDAYANDIKNDDLKSALTKARTELRRRGEVAAKRVKKYVDAIWNTGTYWFRDPLVTTYHEIDWQ